MVLCICILNLQIRVQETKNLNHFILVEILNVLFFIYGNKKKIIGKLVRWSLYINFELFVDAYSLIFFHTI